MLNKKTVVNAEDYLWVRVLPDDFYEDGVNCIWCNIKEKENNPVNIRDIVYYNKLGHPQLIGKVISIFTYSEHAEEDIIYFANPIKKD